MTNRKTTFFYAVLIAIASLAVGMVISSRLGLTPLSSAQTAAPPMNSAPITGPLTATTFRDIAKAVSPAVVNIRTESRQRTQDLNDFFGGQGGDLFERFFGQPMPRPQQQPRDQVVQAAGTGFIIDKAGFILTNNHVVEGATRIRVSLYGGQDEDQTYDARVIGRDPLTDSALIELTEKPDHTLPEVKFGDSGQVFPGDWVVAIGNPFGLAHTVTVGVISAIERPFPIAESRFAQVLQTDAAINPGNSGGPLLNLRGEVVGINTAIISEGRPGNVGVGFAMPINVVRELLPQLRVGKITRGRIGVGIGSVPADAVDEFGLKERSGAVVLNVAPGGAAAKAGIEPGDVIISYNGKPIRNRDELVAMVTATKPGTSVPVRIVRDRQERTLTINVEELDLEAESSQRAGNGNNNGAGPQETTSGFGITLGNVTPEVAQRLRLNRNTQGAVVMNVESGSAAARAGLSEGDVIVRVGQQAITSATEASRELGRVAAGGTAFLRVLRNGQETFVAVTKE
jgi:serine protease Do